MTSPSRTFRKRSASEIQQLLQEHACQGQKSTTFCQQHGISHQTLYNWQKKYGYRPVKDTGFIPVTLAGPVDTEPVVFCELTVAGQTTIRFFQPVDARYLRTLVAR
jgi:Transposase